MAIDRINRVVRRGAVGAPGGSGSSGAPRVDRRRPVVVLMRSLAMVALAGIGILVVLPAALAAQAASAL